jgi:hypothetical protein
MAHFEIRHLHFSLAVTAHQARAIAADVYCVNKCIGDTAGLDYSLVITLALDIPQDHRAFNRQRGIVPIGCKCHVKVGVSTANLGTHSGGFEIPDARGVVTA